MVFTSSDINDGVRKTEGGNYVDPKTAKVYACQKSDVKVGSILTQSVGVITAPHVIRHGSMAARPLFFLKKHSTGHFGAGRFMLPATSNGVELTDKWAFTGPVAVAENTGHSLSMTMRAASCDVARLRPNRLTGKVIATTQTAIRRVTLASIREIRRVVAKARVQILHGPWAQKCPMYEVGI